MADKKISALTELASADADDVLAIVDTSAGVTKKIQKGNLVTGVTNSAGANVLPKSNGTNLVASRIEDNGTTEIELNSGSGRLYGGDTDGVSGGNALDITAANASLGDGNTNAFAFLGLDTLNRRATLGNADNSTTIVINGLDATKTIVIEAANGVTVNGTTLPLNFGAPLWIPLNNTVLAQATGTVYSSPGSIATPLSVTAEGNVSWPCPRAGVVRALHARTGGTAKTNTPATTVTVRKNGADTTLTLALTETINTTSSDLTHSFTVAAGDLITVSFAVSGAAAVSTSIAGVSFLLN